VTDLVYSDSSIPLSRDPGRWILPGNAVIKEQPPGSPAVALTGQTPLLAALLDRYGADPNVPGHTFGVAFLSELFALAMPGDREEQRRGWGVLEVRWAMRVPEPSGS
jgi:hypothetical protein